MEKELIKITTDEEGMKLVSGRELHEFLEVGRDFTTWIKSRISKYGFAENMDFTVVSIAPQNWGASHGGENKLDYVITIDMAKELSMVENNKKGRQARRYFIQCEKQLKEVSQKALLLEKIYNGGAEGIEASKKLAELEKKPLIDKIEGDKPFVELAKERIAKGDKISLTDITKALKLKRGQISTYLKSNGYIHKTNTEINKKGEGMFGIYREGGFKCIGILEKGIDFINDNLEEIKMTKCRKCK